MPVSDPQQPSSKYKDCQSCRIVGSATFATVGTYALWQSRAAAPGSPSQRRIVAGLGLGMHPLDTFVQTFDLLSALALLAGSVVRWVQ
jgi:hypothetical protein